jgi:hypothetical protein
MFTTKRVFALAALMMAASVGTVEMSRNTARAAEPMTMTPIEAYSAGRVETAFDLVAAMPASAPFMVPMAQKGDLLVPPGCTDTDADAQDECMDAYEMDSPKPGIRNARSARRRCWLDPMTLAGVTDGAESQARRRRASTKAPNHETFLGADAQRIREAVALA